ncbi:MAG: hypothetical protein QXP06_02810 [Candidatus Bathyarchaeia archaeon]
MIGCYVTGTLPRPKELVEVTRAYDRKKICEDTLEKAFQEATIKVVNAQASAGLSYITDGMLIWQDLLRPFTENLQGIEVGGLARWFNNNTFYRKPIVLNEIRRTKNVIPTMFTKFLPKELPWKAILPAPYTFAKLADNRFYKNLREVMFAYSEALNEEIESLTAIGFKYIQLSEPALVYNPQKETISKDVFADVHEALRTALKGVEAKTSLQTFFGDFSQLLPEALDFPVDDLGIDLYETSLEKLKDCKFDKGIALGLVDARNSSIEDENELVQVAEKMIDAIYPSKSYDIFVCPNCDLEYLPWERAEEKLKVISSVARRLKDKWK